MTLVLSFFATAAFASCMTANWIANRMALEASRATGRRMRLVGSWNLFEVITEYKKAMPDGRLVLAFSMATVSFALSGLLGLYSFFVLSSGTR